MNLLFVSGEYPPDVGGLGDYTASLRTALAARGWPSRVLSRRDVGRWDARALLQLLRVAPRSGIVHIQYQPAAYDLLGDVCLVPSLLRRLRPSVRVVTTFHDARLPYLFPRAGSLRRGAVRLLASSSHAILAADARDLRALGGPLPSWYHVPIGSNVACAPSPDYDRSAVRAALGFQPGALVIAYFGLRNASKGLDLLLDSFDLVARSAPRARLLLLGGPVGASDPTDRQTAQLVSSRVGALGSRVVQTGWLPPVALSAHLLAADLALLPYSDGASGRRGSLLACAEHGLPIVSTQPASPDVASALCAVAPSPDALASAVLRLANEPASLHRLQQSARALAATRAWPLIADQHVAIYRRLLTPAQ